MMIKDGLKKQLLDTFSVQVQKNFTTYCLSHELNPSLDAFTTYLVDIGMINNSAIQRYTVLATFEELKRQRKAMNKTQLVDVLADRFHLTPRSIWNMLRTQRQ